MEQANYQEQYLFQCSLAAEFAFQVLATSIQTSAVDILNQPLLHEKHSEGEVVVVVEDYFHLEGDNQCKLKFLGLAKVIAE